MPWRLQSHLTSNSHEEVPVIITARLEEAQSTYWQSRRCEFCGASWDALFRRKWIKLLIGLGKGAWGRTKGEGS